ncbi:MAG: hypothetical protein KDD04_02150, partial [Sinomicrobium sp.]|nr:hypothetical protein [Sinomicrobium sp.]
HIALKRYAQAEHHLKSAVEKDPGNLWYLDALYNLYKIQNNELEAIRLGEQLAQKHYRYKENLVQLYARYQNYKEAIRLLDELDQTLGASTQRKQQRIRYTMLMNVKDNAEKPVAEEDKEKQHNPLDAIQARIDGYQNASDYNGMLVYINEVLETYPSQSKFYYVKGKTLNRLEKHTEAAAALETALDFLVDDPALEDTIYRELVAAYKALGKTEKVREYSKKIKSNP